MKVTMPVRRRPPLLLIALIAALTAVFALAVPAWASTVQIQDDARVLDATRVQNAAAELPVGIYLWTTTQDAANKSVFDTDVRNKVGPTFPIAMGINTQAQHVSIQIGSRAGLAQSAAVAAERRAVDSFVSTMRGSHDYTAATLSSIDSLRSSLVAGHRSRGAVGHAPARSSGAGVLLIILLLVVGIAVVAIMLGRRRGARRGPPWGPRSGRGGPPPPMGPYPGDYDQGYGPGYGAPYRSGMGPGAAGAIGAVGGGLLGYELGKSVGEEHQFREDELRYGDGQGGPDGQGDWIVGQDGDFGGGDMSGGGGGDW